MNKFFFCIANVRVCMYVCLRSFGFDNNIWRPTGILRYKVDFQSLQADEPLDDVDLDDY